jgi:hypothetical protein
MHARELTNVPAGHDVVQKVEPKILRLEAPQDTQDDAPGDGPYVPAGHGKHDDKLAPPGTSLYLPAAHNAQALEFVPSVAELHVPTGQGKGVAEARGQK